MWYLLYQESTKIQDYFFLPRHWLGSSLNWNLNLLLFIHWACYPYRIVSMCRVLAVPYVWRIWGLWCGPLFWCPVLCIGKHWISYDVSTWMSQSQQKLSISSTVFEVLPPHSWGIPGKIHLFRLLFGFWELWGKIYFRQMPIIRLTFDWILTQR